MVEKIEEVFIQLAEEYLLTKKEAEKIVDNLKDILTGKVLKDLFASSQRIDFARNLIEPLIEEEVKNRYSRTGDLGDVVFELNRGE